MLQTNKAIRTAALETPPQVKNQAVLDWVAVAGLRLAAADDDQGEAVGAEADPPDVAGRAGARQPRGPRARAATATPGPPATRHACLMLASQS